MTQKGGSGHNANIIKNQEQKTEARGKGNFCFVETSSSLYQKRYKL